MTDLALYLSLLHAADARLSLRAVHPDAFARYADLAIQHGVSQEQARELDAARPYRARSRVVLAANVGTVLTGWADELPAHNFYVQVASVRAGERRGGLDSLDCARALWVDIDGSAAIGHIETLRQRIAAARIHQPTAIVRTSPKGWHCYWALDDPFALADPVAQARFRRVLYGLAQRLGGDLRATDPARVLRPPGTVNRPSAEKRTQGRSESAVELVAFDHGRYAFAALEIFGVDAPPSESRSDEPTYDTRPYTGQLPDRAAIVLGCDPDAADYYRGATYGLQDVSDSSIDLRLARTLAEHDLEGWEIEHAVRASRDERGCAKQHGDRHFVRTVNRALEQGDTILEQPAAHAVAAAHERDEKPAASDAVAPSAAPDPVISSTGADGWGDPGELDDQDSYGPDAPLAAFPAALRDMIEATAHRIQAPPDLVALSALTTFAAAAQRAAKVEVSPGHIEQLSLFGIGVARPSERKSPVHKAMTAPLFEWQRQHNARNAERLREVDLQRRSLQSRIRGLEAARNRPPSSKARTDPQHWDDQIAELERQLEQIPAPLPVQLTVDDITPERLSEVMTEQGDCIALLSDEGGTFVNTLFGRYDSATDRHDLDIWLKGYDGGRIQVERKKERLCIVVEEPRITVGLFAQPKLLHQIGTDDTLAGRGMFARMLFVRPRSRVGGRRRVRDETDPVVVQRYADALGAIFDIPPGARVMTLDAEASQLFDSYETRIESSLLGRLEGIEALAAKHPARAARIAGIWHLVRCGRRGLDRAIDGRTMQAAIDVAEWLLAHQICIAEWLWGVSDARLVLQWARRRNKRAASVREIKRGVSRRTDPVDVELAIEQLVTRGWARLGSVQGRNRLGVRIEFHPAIFAQD